MNDSEQRIDYILRAFACMPVPNGLAQHISAGIAQRAAESPETKRRFFVRSLDPMLVYMGQRLWPIGAGLVLLTAGWLFVVMHSGPRQLVYQPSPITTASSVSPQTAPTTPLSQVISVQRQHPYHHIAQSLVTPLQDASDVTALAESLAPSHLVPPLPITPQEALLLRSARRGQPIEVAELETRREAALTVIASSRERADLREYIRGLLGPLATAQTLTSSSQQPGDTDPAGSVQPPSYQ